eukprot:scaffold22267_cov159-Skeletonema_dohrnii-CCMP3373.AAC.3
MSAILIDLQGGVDRHDDYHRHNIVLPTTECNRRNLSRVMTCLGERIIMTEDHHDGSSATSMMLQKLMVKYTVVTPYQVITMVHIKAYLACMCVWLLLGGKKSGEGERGKGDESACPQNLKTSMSDVGGFGL